MTETDTKVVYLSQWLDCPDVILKRNYAMQDKIREARIHFFYKLREEGCTEEKAKFLYSVWIGKNRQRLKLIVSCPSEDPVQ